jgi:hypothetical protein
LGLIVSLPIPLDFIAPKGAMRFRQAKIPAIVSMPKTAMYEYGYAVFWKHNVRLARQIFYVEPETETCRMKRAPDKDLRLGVRAFDRSHHATSGFLIDYISQPL